MYQCVQHTAPVYLCELMQPKKISNYCIVSYARDHLQVLESGSEFDGDGDNSAPAVQLNRIRYTSK